MSFYFTIYIELHIYDFILREQDYKKVHNFSQKECHFYFES